VGAFFQPDKLALLWHRYCWVWSRITKTQVARESSDRHKDTDPVVKPHGWEISAHTSASQLPMGGWEEDAPPQTIFGEILPAGKGRGFCPSALLW